MAYAATGTAGNDTLNQAGDTGPGTIVGLAGDDCIIAGTGAVQAFGNSGNDSVFLRSSSTGSVFGGSENDFILGPSTGIEAVAGPLLLFGDEGSDTIAVSNASGAQTVVGGHDSSDGGDLIFTGTGADLLFGNGGNDTMSAATGNDTFIGGFGNDQFADNGGANLIFGNEGNDSYRSSTGGADTFFGGLGNDSAFADGGSPVYFGNEGADTVDGAANSSAMTVVGGNDSADGSDSIVTGSGADFVFGNGGNDTVDVFSGADTFVGGFGNDSLLDNGGTGLFFLNEGNDSVNSGGGGANTVFGGLGNDTIRMTIIGGRDTIQGNEGNDTIRGNADIDTISGGSGNDVFAYTDASDDGNNAAGGGPVELITDVNWAEDKFRTDVATVTFAANMGAGTGADLNSSANNAIAAAFALSGNPAAVVAAQFTFGGHTYLAINQDATLNQFLDAGDLLLDITGATGTIAASAFT
jgi:Ca2+-binding RTX toxin-like protein